MKELIALHAVARAAGAQVLAVSVPHNASTRRGAEAAAVLASLGLEPRSAEVMLVVVVVVVLVLFRLLLIPSSRRLIAAGGVCQASLLRQRPTDCAVRGEWQPAAAGPGGT